MAEARRHRLLASLALALCAAPAFADDSQPVPPGEGMIEQPCPIQEGLSFASPYVRQYDWAWLCRYRAENGAIDPGKPPAVVFIGDSITEGWAKLDPGFFAHGNVDRGIGGQTSPQILLRFYQDVVALHPRVVHIMAGANDVAGNSGPTSVEAYRNNIRAMVDLARANGIAVVLGSIPPTDHFYWSPNLTPAPRIAELDMWLRDIARERGLVYADYYAAMVEAGGRMRPAYTGDGVHPNAAGYAVMRPIAERAIAEAEKRSERPARR